MTTATARTASIETLFHRWRKGDSAAGQAMAQRFTDWYFAIAASRLGEEAGDDAFREACTQFSRGVGKLTDARRLLGWAHTIARKEIEGATPGGRLHDGDLPSAFTREQHPKELLARARDHLPHEMYLLETAFRGDPVDDAIALLRARYRVKTWLAQTFEVPFRVTPDRPDPDRAPLTFYEAGRMSDENEETLFELYLLHDMEVCQDVAEFAHYAIALRGGLPGEVPSAQTHAPVAGPLAASDRPDGTAGPGVVASPPSWVASTASAASPQRAATLPGYARATGAAALLLGLLFVALYVVLQ